MKHLLVTIFAAIAVSVAGATDAARLVRLQGSEPILLDPSSTIRVAQGAEIRLGIENITSAKYHEITWYKNDVAIPGANSAVLVLADLQELASGTYTAMVKTPCAARRTSPVVINVEPEGPSVTSTPTIAGYQLQSVLPNPVSSKATITFSVPAPCKVHLKVVDMVGHDVATILNADVASGTHTAEFVVSGSDIPSTLYYVVLSTQGFKTSQPMIVVK
ncbi:MAG: hypothetical protein FGM33_03775 [Candidatus Kapabacteria bacterium]|nr:hypothetical protein [Candidatus Kapabacteria bacterium]